MKLIPWKATDNPPDTPFSKDLDKALDRIFGFIAQILNKGITLEDNLNAQVVTLTTDATPGTETAVPHTLKRVPTGFVILGLDKAGVLYNGATANSSSILYVRSNLASVTATILIV